jgi:hypothetical protein
MVTVYMSSTVTDVRKGNHLIKARNHIKRDQLIVPSS